MKYCYTLVITFLFSFIAFGQIGIGTTVPRSSLDIRSSSQASPSNQDGILIPKIDAFPGVNPTGFQHGMLVFLTTTQGSDQPGFYYWDQPSVSWIGLKSGNNSGWEITGNSGTVSGVNFIGTTDSQALDFRVNNVRRMRLETNGTLATLNMGKSVYIGLEAGNADTYSMWKYNVAVGEYALRNNTSGVNMVAIGGDALRANLTGTRNIGIGKDALTNNDSGDDNIAIGKDALNDNIDGNRNIAIGNNTLQSITTGNGNIGLGYQSNSSVTTITNAVSIGGFNWAATNQVKIGNSWHTSIGGEVGWSTFSDGRFKSDVKENVPGLDFILKLRPVTYQINPETIDTFFKANQLSGYKEFTENFNKKDHLYRQTGFIAQEVNDTAKKINYDFDGVDIPKDDSKSNYALKYATFVVPLVKAIQEQQKMIKAQGLKIARLQQEINAIKQ